MQNLLIQDEDDGNHAKIQLEGLEVVQETQAAREEEIAPHAMLIHTGNSYDSMSGLSTNSKSTTGSVQWEKSTEGKERTIENVHLAERGKIMNSCAKYDLKEDEIKKWLRRKHSKAEEKFYEWTLIEIAYGKRR